VSPGCKNCYAATISARRGHTGLWAAKGERRVFGDSHWREPLAWQRAAARAGVRRRVFSSSMCDNFEDHPQIAAELPRFWRLVRETPSLDWQILTKRSDRIAASLPPDWGEGYPNAWLGVSIENRDYLRRLDDLRAVPAAVRFMSYEPALGPIADGLDLRGIHWVIYGGESGPGYREHDPQWARDVRDVCTKASVPFFYKQSPAPRTEMGITLDGAIVRSYPAPPA
jgi:protein gp37